MLSSILTKKQCSECKFCCSFRRKSAWETPLFPKPTIDRLEKKYDAFPIRQVKNSFTYDLQPGYRTQNPEEEQPCPFLDASDGCTLDENDKPFDCKIWPLRIMKKENELVIALTPTCPAVNTLPLEQVKKLVTQEGTGETIYREAERFPDIVKEYREGYPILMSRRAASGY